MIRDEGYLTAIISMLVGALVICYCATLMWDEAKDENTRIGPRNGWHQVDSRLKRLEVK